MKPIVLASASPRRKALLCALGINLRVQPSACEEILDGTPTEVVISNATAKRDDVAGRLEEPVIVVGADTIVVFEGRILGKPGHREKAREMLRTLSGGTNTVYTGLALVDTETGASAQGVERTDVTFRELSESEIDAFVEAVNPIDRAGAYTCDGPGSLLIGRYEGCYHNVLGLPIVRLDLLFREIGDTLFARIDATRALYL